MNIYGIIILCILLYFATFGTCFFIASAEYKPKLMKIFLGLLTFGIATIIMFFRNKIILKKYPYIRADLYDKFKRIIGDQESYDIINHFYLFDQHVAVVDGVTRYSQEVYDALRKHMLDTYLPEIKEIDDKLL